jgi:predicted transcriptional regulator
MKTVTKTDRVLAALKNGEELTAKQIASRFSIKHPASAVRALRGAGYAVYCNEKKNSKGEVKNFYRLGTPSRAMVAAAYAVGVNF